MPFIPPIALIRKRHIVKKLQAHRAFSPETAISLADAGVINPNGFDLITKKLLSKGILCQTADGKFYLP